MAPGGTITRTVYDALGRASGVWVGTDDTPSSGEWSPTNNSGANMVKVAEYEYDGGNAGNGNRTQLTQPVDGTSANDRVTKFKYDWRDRRVSVVDAEEFSSKVTYSHSDLDNLGRVKKAERYYDADDDESFPDDGTVDGGDRLLARRESLYDKLGRVYRAKTYAAMWYDGADRQTDQADYGTNGGGAFSRPSSAPARADTVLVTTTEYNTAGLAYKTTDPASKEHRTEFDDLGRATKTIQNYEDGTVEQAEPDKDVSVETVYNADGLVAELEAQNPTTGAQTTYYVCRQPRQRHGGRRQRGQRGGVRVQ